MNLPPFANGRMPAKRQSVAKKIESCCLAFRYILGRGSEMAQCITMRRWVGVDPCWSLWFQPGGCSEGPVHPGRVKFSMESYST